MKRGTTLVDSDDSDISSDDEGGAPRRSVPLLPPLPNGSGGANNRKA
jgi:hypothetical protein